MYCIHCGVRLADTESKCPLCSTVVYHPDLKQPSARPLYPRDKLPGAGTGSNALNGAIIILFLLPLIICFFSDLQVNGRLDWFGLVAGALILAYTTLALPLWFKKPNPVIFVPPNFVLAAVYLLYIDLTTGGSWFLSFAFPVVGGLCLITCAVVTLLHYLRRGKLFVIGGASIALGAFMLLIEFLLDVTFRLTFIGWSIYPMAALILLGGLTIYIAASPSARELIERKLFF